MIQVDGRAEFVGRRVRLAFRTTHIDKAGETSAVRAVDAEIVELDAAGGAILVTDDGLHFRFPAALLAGGGPAPEYVGGQELVRDFHNAVEPVTLRWLVGDSLRKALAEAAAADPDAAPDRGGR